MIKITQDVHKKISADMELSNYPKSNIYLYNYQTETAIFIAAKLEKTIIAVI